MGYFFSFLQATRTSPFLCWAYVVVDIVTWSYVVTCYHVLARAYTSLSPPPVLPTTVIPHTDSDVGSSRILNREKEVLPLSSRMAAIPVEATARTMLVLLRRSARIKFSTCVSPVPPGPSIMNI